MNADNVDWANSFTKAEYDARNAPKQLPAIPGRHGITPSVQPGGEFVSKTALALFPFLSVRQESLVLSINVHPNMARRKIWFSTDYATPAGRALVTRLVATYKGVNVFELPYEFQRTFGGAGVALRFDNTTKPGVGVGTADDECLTWESPKSAGSFLCINPYRCCAAIDRLDWFLSYKEDALSNNISFLLAVHSEFPY